MSTFAGMISRRGHAPFPHSDLPIRSDTPHNHDLRAFGLALGRGLTVGVAAQPLDVRRHIRVIEREIGGVVTTLNAAFQRGETVTPAANWLLDNSYLIEEALAEVRRDLPPRFYRQLPLLAGVEIPRVLEIAWRYVELTDSAVSLDGFTAITQGYQSAEPLQIGELWALPSILRFVLLENLRRLALRVEQSRKLRDLANTVADGLASTPEDADVEILEGNKDHALDRSFATQLLHRLRDGSRSSSTALKWLEEKLERSGSDAEEVILREHTTQSTGNVTTGNIIRGLRLIDDTDWTDWFEDVSEVDRILRENTDFAALDFRSRDTYRQAIEQLAKGSGIGEIEVANRAIARSNGKADKHGEDGDGTDIGNLLVGRLRPQFEAEIGHRVPMRDRIFRAYRRAGWVGMAIPVLMIAMLMVSIAANSLDEARLSSGKIGLLIMLFAVPAWDAALGLYTAIVTLIVQPSRLVGYEYKAGVPAEARTMVVTPTILASRDDVDDAIHRLEVHYLSNMSGQLHFSVLSDWPDSQTEVTQRDTEILEFARLEIARLNAKYPDAPSNRFFLLHRQRVYNPSEGCWMGWERKRGKLVELNALLRGDKDTTFLAPDDELPGDVRYVMTLDADTKMTRDAVRKLVGKLQHPLNHPVVDARSGAILSGYGILQPRVTPSLTTGDEASFFQRVFSSQRGIDPYVFTVSDAYQDLYEAGSFTGKGLYHVDAFEAALKGRIPENTVLSHDLLEGALARAALVSDVELIEDYPTRYLVDASRQHRWTRGDWQLLGWALKPGNGVDGVSRWKLIDNLRRSVAPIFWVAASIAGWTLLRLPEAALWQTTLVLALFVSLTINLVDSLVHKSTEVTFTNHIFAFARDAMLSTAQVAVQLLLAAHKSWMLGDAIVRSLYRIFASRRNLLEWRTALSATRESASSIVGHYRAMYGAVVIAVVAVAAPTAAGSSGVVVASVFALLWLLSPAAAWLISQSAETEDRLKTSPGEVAELRGIARRTWLYFETFVTAAHNMLPPDNFQETPTPVVAPRTSPTNIGLYLLSVVSARDFGWISFSDTLTRLTQTLDTLDKMERHRGHFYNWYDIETLRPLLPLYVSSVDSGNLAGHLIAVSSACRIWAEAPAAYLQGDFEGIVDVIAILEDRIESLPDDRRTLRPLRQRLVERLEGMRRAVSTIRSAPETAAFRTISLKAISVDIHNLARSLDAETASSESKELALWAHVLERTCQAHLEDSHTEASANAALRHRLAELGERARKFAFEMDFAFLLNADRKLLSIGYRVAENQLDESCYDLLASEARLASLFGIAKGDIPTEHWFRLGRPVVQIGMSGALVSWSGSMFEYLMPPLVMKEPLGGILNQSNNLIISKQISYARPRSLPWGISEAAYNARDREMTYQYTNFGVPGLGLKRGLSDELVVAPYASLLAAQFRPKAALRNLRLLKALGSSGLYGFHDAIDFTASRLPAGQTHVVVRNFMAHHHGMSIVAVANVTFDGRMRDRFHADPVIEAAELLLQEKAPRNIPATPIRAEASDRVKPAMVDSRPDSRRIEDPLHELTAVNIMSNGHYNVMLTSTGTGYSRADQTSVTRWSGDATEDRSGTFIFLRDLNAGTWWSATAEPRRAPGETTTAHFSEDRAVFTKLVGNLKSELECIVLGDGNGEARRVTLSNEGEDDAIIELTSFAELALNSEASDSAHPAFSKMFVQTEISDDLVIFATRRRRTDTDPTIALAHFVTSEPGIERELSAETDRRTFIGRGRSIADAAAFDVGAQLSGSAGDVLDPIMALRCKVRVPPHKKVTVTFWTVVAANRDDIGREIQRYRHGEGFSRQAMLAWTRSQIQARHVGLSLSEAAGVQRLARYLLFPDPGLRAQPDRISGGLGSQSLLWPMSISGDFPIFAIRIGDIADIEIVREALRMQEYLRSHGLLADLVIINEQASSYVQDLQNAIELLCENARLRGRQLGPRQHIFCVRRDLINKASYNTLIAAARAVLHTRNGSVINQIERAELAAETAGRGSFDTDPAARKTIPRADGKPESDRAGEDLMFWNGFGGFSDAGKAYVVRLGTNQVTPQPWINVISNESFGFHTSAEGASFTWSVNSRDFQLTPWSNDPVENRPGESFYIHDLDRKEVCSPLACVAGEPSFAHEARFERGCSIFTGRSSDLVTCLTQLVDPVEPVKIQQLSIRNMGTVNRRLRVYAYAEWVLGNSRSRFVPFIIPEYDGTNQVLTARNPYHTEFGDRVAFLAADAPNQSVTSARTEFLGRGGSTRAPEAVVQGRPLSGTVVPGGDLCAAIACDVEVGPGETRDILFVLGDAHSREEATQRAKHHLTRDFGQRETETRSRWEDFAAPLQVSSPDRAFDAMVNVWLPYQSLACRVLARSAFYQASGAFGFRDQLQDTLSLMLHDPNLARGQILNAAKRQFGEGDVQHWWLPRTGAGVRTMISDDVVWLAYSTQHYISVTGDDAILDEALAFLSGPELETGKHDAFFTPDVSHETASLYEHCARALDLAIARSSPRGLPLILGGDWNDGMNRVGEAGKGESVWLGWFLCKVLRDFAPLADGRGDSSRASQWRHFSDRLTNTLNSDAWDGNWFLRGTFDDGSPLGSHHSDECRIDSIAQSWSVISGAGRTELSSRAMDSVLDHLLDEDLDIVKLFTPPFANTDKEPGYIKQYPPGLRENGGQYTHAAIWVVIALANLGRNDDAYRVFSALNPINHARTRQDAERYRVEPYVVAADIYSHSEMGGRGGWTWYTGSAGWLYRAAVESILGIHREGDFLRIEPHLPSSWDQCAVSLTLGKAIYSINIRRGGPIGIVLDGSPTEGKIKIEPGHHSVSISI